MKVGTPVFFVDNMRVIEGVILKVDEAGVRWVTHDTARGLHTVKVQPATFLSVDRAEAERVAKNDACEVYAQVQKYEAAAVAATARANKARLRIPAALLAEMEAVAAAPVEKVEG